MRSLVAANRPNASTDLHQTFTYCLYLYADGLCQFWCKSVHALKSVRKKYTTKKRCFVILYKFFNTFFDFILSLLQNFVILSIVETKRKLFGSESEKNQTKMEQYSIVKLLSFSFGTYTFDASIAWHICRVNCTGTSQNCEANWIASLWTKLKFVRMNVNKHSKTWMHMKNLLEWIAHFDVSLSFSLPLDSMWIFNSSHKIGVFAKNEFYLLWIVWLVYN